MLFDFSKRGIRPYTVHWKIQVLHAVVPQCVLIDTVHHKGQIVRNLMRVARRELMRISVFEVWGKNGDRWRRRGTVGSGAQPAIGISIDGICNKHRTVIEIVPLFFVLLGLDIVEIDPVPCANCQLGDRIPGDADTRRKAIEGGAAGLFTKPIDFPELRGEIGRRLEEAMGAA